MFVVCLLAAWLRGPADAGSLASRPGSVLFGERVIDGVLFPVLALGVRAFAARVGLETVIKPAVFRLAIPILISLVVIRLIVRILTRALPAVAWVRTVERSISWIAWIAAVLWLTGVLPSVLDAMDEVQWKIGATKITPAQRRRGHDHRRASCSMLALWVSAVLERRLLATPAARTSRCARSRRRCCAPCCCSSA